MDAFYEQKFHVIKHLFIFYMQNLTRIYCKMSTFEWLIATSFFRFLHMIFYFISTVEFQLKFIVSCGNLFVSSGITTDLFRVFPYVEQFCINFMERKKKYMKKNAKFAVFYFDKFSIGILLWIEDAVGGFLDFFIHFFIVLVVFRSFF